MANAAQRLIERIRSEYTQDRDVVGPRFKALVSNSLEVLSSQLYEKSTHFLLEIIQNADDNTYNIPTPTLIFSYAPGSLRVDCNEVGFTAGNVEAICAINQSTKSDKKTDGEYIGEKGIGFKSVFKAADVAWVSSGEYMFKFDKTEFLGMVTPMWAKFPEETRSGWTSIYLSLSKDFEEKALVQELRTFDVNLLIFLRRIKEIHINMAGDGEYMEQKISKSEHQLGNDRVITLRAGDSNNRYLIRTYVIEKLPQEMKRPDWNRTKILLGFPVADSHEAPQLIPQKVYAFLPVRNYGLKFLLQGDFLLTANREDIESTLPWNCRLRDAVAEAFIESVHHFNKGEMKYTWPWYLPDPLTTTNSFFDIAIQSIMKSLRELPVLESCAGTMEEAGSLESVPSNQFVDRSGTPFTLSSHTATRYLSSKYPEWVVQGTLSIGVSQLSPPKFLKDLSWLVNEDPQAFYTKPLPWHSQLAESLYKLTIDGDLLSSMQKIYPIPLQDGTWASAQGKSMFFSKGDSSLEVPSGIDVLIVDKSAESDPNIRRLLVSLGVKAWEAPEICRLILREHDKPGFDAKALTTDQLISHAAFLYKSSWQPPKDVDIWFATTQDGRCFGRKLYIAGNIASNPSATRVFAKLQEQFPVIHNSYLEAFPSDVEWPHWLVKNLGLSMIPRLITPLIEPKPQAILKTQAPSSSSSALNENAESTAPGLAASTYSAPDSPQTLQRMQEHALRPTRTGHFSKPRLSNTRRTIQQQNAMESPMPRLEPNNHALADYQVQFMLVEQQNKKRLLKARLEHDTNKPNDVAIDSNFGFFAQDPSLAREESRPVPQVMTPDHGDQNYKAYQTGADLSAQDGGAETIFALSDEFTYMFSECRSSDVLQILRDNWHHYSQWISGPHMSWQDPEYVVSSAQLKYQIGSYAVKSASSTMPLRETVLPAIDRQLELPDQGSLIPAVEIIDPQDADWRFLGSFGVVTIADVYYYLRCLTVISEQDRADIDQVAYIYHKIQSFYKGSEPAIHAAFSERKLVLTPARPFDSKGSNWKSIEDCLAWNIAIEDEYPNSSYLFRCLSSPSGDPIASLVAKAASISSSSKLEDISRLFGQISKALKNVTSPEAAQLLRPLHKCAVFPIVNDSGDRMYDRLSSMDDASWFIADHPPIRESFHGKLPLLALSTKDIAASEALFCVLRLDNRLLSKLVTDRTRPVGRVKTHWIWTSSLRAKRPFLRALIPQSHSNRATIRHRIENRATIMHRIENIHVSIAPFLSQTYVMKRGGITVEGNSVGGRACLDITENSLNMFLTEETAAAKSPPYELSVLLADQLDIKDVNHRNLLYTVLINSNLESLYSTFMQQGIEVDGLVCDKSKSRYQAQRGDLTRIPSPFWKSTARLGEYGSNAPDVLKFGGFRSWRHNHESNGDRRLPMNELVRLNKYLVEDIQAVPKRLVGWEHLQHLGEHLTSKILGTHLGHLYDPERHWTSELRCRSGHKPLESLDPYAGFTLRGTEIAKQMTAFVTSFGQSLAPNWKEVLRKGSPVYHLDVVVNSRSKPSSFVMSTSQIERMRHYTISDEDTELNTDVALLLQINDVNSSSESSAELIIDPWRLFCSSNLQLEGEWLVTGTSTYHSLEPTAKKRKPPKLSVPWLAEGNLATRPCRSVSSLGHLKRPLFSHRALRPKEIRLINILPGTQQDQLQGVIIHVQSTSAPTYQALSYVWGTDQQTKELVTPDGTLPISPSLSKALHSLRRKDQSITLWVDAICINQKDGREKEKQIRLLPVIFQNASITYAFLEGGDGSDNALEMLMQVRFKAAIEKRSRLYQPLDSREGMETEEEDWPDDLAKVPASWHDNSIPHLDDDIWTHVKALFSLPFFRRVWIVQEVVAALDVKIICGKRTIDWSDLHLAMEIVDWQVQLFDTDTTYLSSSWEPFFSLAAQREWEARSHRRSLSTLLEHFRYTESTLSRDRLFAMLGLASDGNEADFEPDYNSPLEEVVLRFARVFVRQGIGMQLLYRAGLHGHSHRFPSWIPDWTTQKPTSLATISETGITFRASRPQQPMIKCSPDSDELLVDGYTVDVIENISMSSNVEEGLALYFSEVDAMIDRAVLSPSQTSREDLKWKVPIAKALFPKVATSGGVDLQSSYRALRNSLSEKGKGKSVDKGVDFIDRNQGLSYLAALKDTVRGWRFVVTKKGYVGTVPNLAQAGDVIAIMKGGRVPFILQKSNTKSGTFRLVGECYVHGLMNGEGLSLPGVVETTFTLH